LAGKGRWSEGKPGGLRLTAVTHPRRSLTTEGSSEGRAGPASAVPAFAFRTRG
jgi:hypothetical protein